MYSQIIDRYRRYKCKFDKVNICVCRNKNTKSIYKYHVYIFIMHNICFLDHTKRQLMRRRSSC